MNAVRTFRDMGGIFYVYVLECCIPKHYYVGMTENIGHRLLEHLDGNGSAFTSRFGVRRVLGFWAIQGTRWDAAAYEVAVGNLLAARHPDFCVSRGGLCRCAVKGRSRRARRARGRREGQNGKLVHP
jgi:predicted GIY-YIG superfamily endonuclease